MSRGGEGRYGSDVQRLHLTWGVRLGALWAPLVPTDQARGAFGRSNWLLGCAGGDELVAGRFGAVETLSATAQQQVTSRVEASRCCRCTFRSPAGRSDAKGASGEGGDGFVDPSPRKEARAHPRGHSGSGGRGLGVRGGVDRRIEAAAAEVGWPEVLRQLTNGERLCGGIGRQRLRKRSVKTQSGPFTGIDFT